MLTSSAEGLRVSVQPQAPVAGHCFQVWRSADGSAWLEFYRTADGYRLRFPALADFTVSADGQHIEVFPTPTTTEGTLEHLYLNQVLPLALSRERKLVLHASAIELGDSAIAFVGPSGFGKSTLAASFSTSGHRFLTDDGLQLTPAGEHFLINPSHPSIRLWDDSRAALVPTTVAAAPALEYTRKARLLADAALAYCTEARRLKIVYLLDDDPADSTTITALPPGECMMALVKHCFLLDMEERALLEHQFMQFAAIARSVKFFRLGYPRDYRLLPVVRQHIISHARGMPD